MEDLKTMKKALISCVQTQINGNLKEVDAEELGEAVDMIKDLEEAIYYCTITKAMNGESGYEHWGNKEKGKVFLYRKEYQYRYNKNR